VKRQRRLRKLVPDDALFRRRAAGESFRSLAPDYRVAHTTLMDYFKRPEGARALRQAENQLRAERRTAADSRTDERRLEREVRRKAKEQAKRERKQARDTKAASRESASRRRRPPRNDYEAWLDEHDAPVEPLTRADLHSQNDDIAASVVAEGGGIQDVIEATDLRTLENVTKLIDPAILKQALDNDVLRRTQASNSAPP
jgi:hypothetical protein